MLYNLREYHRPTGIDEALRLLQRADIRTVPLAGGTMLVGEGSGQIEAVVDLAGLGLDFIRYEGRTLRIGAMVRLQTIVEEMGDVADGLLSETARRMAAWNIRNAATLGGTLAGGNLHTPLSVALAALGARVEITGGGGELFNWPGIPVDSLRGRLITAVVLDLPVGQISASYEQVGRTPADQPIVCAAAVAGVSADQVITRIAIGGLLTDSLMLIGDTFTGSNTTPGMIDELVNGIPESAILSNFLGSPAYRRGVAPVLARRALVAALGKLGISAG